MTSEPIGAPEKDRQGRILDAVLGLLSRQGISGVSMRAVAREAGVALGLVNYHFADKTSLIGAALRRIEEQDIALVEPDPSLAPEDRLRAALRRVADPEFLTTEYLSLRLQLWALAQADETFADINTAAQQRYRAGLARLIGAAGAVAPRPRPPGGRRRRGAERHVADRAARPGSRVTAAGCRAVRGHRAGSVALERPYKIERAFKWICHVEKLAAPGGYVASTSGRDADRGRPRPHGCAARVLQRLQAPRPRAARRLWDHTQHRVPVPRMDLRPGWRTAGARRADRMATFDTSAICLDQVRVEEFGGFVYVNLDATATPLAEQAADLAAEIDFWAPDVAALTHARRLTYDVRTNWKNVIDNFLECYHCHIAHREFVDLVDMGTYEVRTHGVWSSHFAEAGKHENAAYDVSAATVNQHAVWWLWPNTCLLRYPGRANFMVFQVLPAGPERTLETWDFHFETT